MQLSFNYGLNLELYPNGMEPLILLLCINMDSQIRNAREMEILVAGWVVLI